MKVEETKQVAGLEIKSLSRGKRYPPTTHGSNSPTYALLSHHERITGNRFDSTDPVLSRLAHVQSNGLDDTQPPLLRIEATLWTYPAAPPSGLSLWIEAHLKVPAFILQRFVLHFPGLI